MKNNTYFDELNRNASAWEKKHEAHNARKQQIIEEKGWDSEELKAWYEEEEEFPYKQYFFPYFLHYAGELISATHTGVVPHSTYERNQNIGLPRHNTPPRYGCLFPECPALWLYWREAAQLAYCSLHNRILAHFF